MKLPKLNPRRLLNDGSAEFDYLESDYDFFRNNHEAVIEIMEELLKFQEAPELWTVITKEGAELTRGRK